MKRATVAAALLAIFDLAISGCSTTVQSIPEVAKSLEAGAPMPPAVSGLFRSDASRLDPGPEGGAALAYLNSDAQWSRYTKIELIPVEFWAAADSEVSTSDQQMPTSYFYNKLQEVLSNSFTLVNQPMQGHTTTTC